MEIVSVVNEGLGHSSHVVGLGDGTALVIDPARLPDRQRRLVADRGWRIAWSADTHSHADYISGSPELAVDGAVFLAPARARLKHPHRGVEAGEEIELAGGLVLRAIATPGHTPEHLAYLLVGDRPPLIALNVARLPRNVSTAVLQSRLQRHSSSLLAALDSA